MRGIKNKGKQLGRKLLEAAAEGEAIMMNDVLFIVSAKEFRSKFSYGGGIYWPIMDRMEMPVVD